MNMELAIRTIMDGASDDVRELTSQIVVAIREVAEGKPGYQAAEACIRAAALVGLVCANAGRGSDVLAKGAGLLDALSKEPAIRGVTLQ